ncbi:MAG: type I 3-dehydroquinate dehydratase [Actinobacteria bacterium]|nr:type I 3-dehydroquinate dehydratase [Actinomycetota bacterium]MCG2801884.1 type I 3-dehydroquinate dehydratase [Cellulomonas sp.]
MSSVTVRGVEIGSGLPKVIVPLVGADVEALVGQARAAVAASPDLLEWRLDFLADRSPQAVLSVARALVPELGGRPLLATFRTADEGGQHPIAPDRYVELYGALVEARLVDLVDVEIEREVTAVDAVIAAARAAGVAVIGSFHDFGGTPTVPVMVAKLRTMVERGVDIAKIAVMPHDAGDVLALLQATWTASQELPRPLITMSMAGTGVVSRLAGEVFGSAATFGTVGQASAPGQVEVPALRAALQVIHSAV